MTKKQSVKLHVKPVMTDTNLVLEPSLVEAVVVPRLQTEALWSLVEDDQSVGEQQEEAVMLQLDLELATHTNQSINQSSCKDWIWLSSVLHPRQHSTGYMGDGFTGQQTQPTVSKYWRNI